ncbi:MAG: acylphosphatase [Candidatus Thermoplasmatota archaeon]
MNNRAILIVRGDVQEVGYRAKIMSIAQKLGLVGYVENLNDGTVRIVCEGEKKIIEKFAEKIKIKNELMEVERIDIEYEEAKNEFNRFEVKISDFGMELFQGFVTAGKVLTAVRNDVKDVGRKVECVGEKVSAMHKDVGKKVECIGERVFAMHKDVVKRFDRIDKRYDYFGKGISRLDKKMDILTKEFKIMNKQFGKLVNYILKKK